MKQLFLRQEGNPRLLLFFSGWGADECLFDREVEDGYDYLLCFDYRSLDFDYSLLKPYKEIRLLAWSMGVWVACRIFSGMAIPWQMKLAVNGTPFPIHDTKGIPRSVFNKTLEHFSETGLVRFRRRICGSVESVREFLSHKPYRPLEELRDELFGLNQEILIPGNYPFVWDKALIGMKDKIFPPSNQMEAWKGTTIVKMDIEHYDAVLFQTLLSGKGDEWIKV